ncbi:MULTISPECIES: HU family DNA-binding protein [Cupriavidus]
MTKQELVAMLTERIQPSKPVAERLFNAELAALSEAIIVGSAGPGLATFAVKARAAREGRNPKTGVGLTIKASVAVVFRPAEARKARIKSVRAACRVA